MAMTRRLNCVYLAYRPLGRFFALPILDSQLNGHARVQKQPRSPPRRARDRRALRREARRPSPRTSEQIATSTDPYTPLQQEATHRSAEQVTFGPTPDFGDPPAATAAAAASPRPEAAAAPVLG